MMKLSHINLLSQKHIEVELMVLKLEVAGSRGRAMDYLMSPMSPKAFHQSDFPMASPKCCTKIPSMIATVGHSAKYNNMSYSKFQ